MHPAHAKLLDYRIVSIWWQVIIVTTVIFMTVLSLFYVQTAESKVTVMRLAIICAGAYLGVLCFVWAAPGTMRRTYTNIWVLLICLAVFPSLAAAAVLITTDIDMNYDWDAHEAAIMEKEWEDMLERETGYGSGWYDLAVSKYREVADRCQEGDITADVLRHASSSSHVLAAAGQNRTWNEAEYEHLAEAVSSLEECIKSARAPP